MTFVVSRLASFVAHSLTTILAYFAPPTSITAVDLTCNLLHSKLNHPLSLFVKSYLLTTTQCSCVYIPCKASCCGFVAFFKQEVLLKAPLDTTHCAVKAFSVQKIINHFLCLNLFSKFAPKLGFIKWIKWSFKL